jgi:Chlorophyll A-B binding protein
MLAFVGAFVQEVYSFPFYTDAPKLFTQGHDWGAHNGALLNILIACSFFEAMTLPAVIQMVKGDNDRQPGEFGLDFFKLGSSDKLMAQKEVKVRCTVMLYAIRAL